MFESVPCKRVDHCHARRPTSSYSVHEAVRVIHIETRSILCRCCRQVAVLWRYQLHIVASDRERVPGNVGLLIELSAAVSAPRSDRPRSPRLSAVPGVFELISASSPQQRRVNWCRQRIQTVGRIANVGVEDRRAWHFVFLLQTNLQSIGTGRLAIPNRTQILQL